MVDGSCTRVAPFTGENPKLLDDGHHLRYKLEMPELTKQEEIEARALLVTDGLKPYPVWVCRTCGQKYNPKKETRSPWATYHTDTCGVCGAVTACTEPRDYNYPKFPGFEKP